MQWAVQILKGLKHLYAPDICPGCDQYEPLRASIFCLSCYSNLPRIDHQHDAKSALRGKLHLNSEIDHVFALYYYTKDGIVQELIHKIKYYSDRHLAIQLGEELGKLIPLEILQSHYLVPVPIHAKRLSLRGYNQSALIAEGIQRTANCPLHILTKLIIRTDESESQTKRSRAARGAYLKEAFEIKKLPSETKPILLIDDVITTGATVSACMNILQREGYHKINIAALAITL